MKAIDFIKDSNEVFKKEEVILNGLNDKEYKVMISKRLKDTDIMAIVDDLLLRSDMCKNEGVRFDAVMCMYSLMVKYFTDIKFSTYPNIKRQFSHEIDMLKALIDLGLLEEILKEFDKSNIEKIQTAFEKYSESFKAINNNIIAQEMLSGEDNGEV